MDPTVDDHIEDRFETYLDDLCALVAQPSISATGEGIRECAEHERERCLSYGFDEAEIVETSGHPAVLARAYVGHDSDNDAPTALVYGHYDVQPVDPEEWTTPPFEPEIRVEAGEELLYGRGTVDNKGQHFTYPCAVRSLRETTGLPCNVTLLLDGEEESGSPNLLDAVEAKEDELAADVSINSDGPIDGSGRPVVSFGNRGILVVGLDVRGPKGDLHSGHYGGAVPNPAWELIRLLGTMRDEHGRITIDGFYDDVAGLADADRDLLDAFEPDEAELLDDLGIGGLQGGPGETFLEKTLSYPSLNVNGIASGHGEEGFKTIVPSDASVTIDMRLVVEQDPDEIFDLFEAHVEEHADDRLETTVTYHASMDPMRTPTATPYFDPVVDAVTDGWGAEPVVKPSSGGSAPYALFTDYLGLPHVSIPYGQNDNNQHSADERFAVEHFRKGIKTSAHLLEAVSTV